MTSSVFSKLRHHRRLSQLSGQSRADIDPGPTRCGYHALQLRLRDKPYEGRFVFVHGTSQEYAGSRMNNLTTSLWNRTDSAICFYDDAGYGGALLARVAPGHSRPNLERGANDRISSWRAC
ncbi:peptidase inhibitor family I36 protein [Streptomyces sp. NPDC057499]|uniref:peptidase inhibitor family I36 protein n=1 Tax=Streptomyces sp. NPDC057499 TaxID=3346150 RepID=UPI0036C10539